MTLQTSASPFGRHRWRWIMVLIGLTSWISIGCTPASLTMMLMPWMDNKLDPEYKLFAADKELTVVILSNFAQPQLHPDPQPAEMELAEKVFPELNKAQRLLRTSILSESTTNYIQLYASKTREDRFERVRQS